MNDKSLVSQLSFGVMRRHDNRTYLSGTVYKKQNKM